MQSGAEAHGAEGPMTADQAAARLMALVEEARALAKSGVDERLVTYILQVASEDLEAALQRLEAL